MFDEKSYSLKMDKAIEVFLKELSSLRTGRANAAMLDLVKVDVYGQQMPINQVGSITTPEPRMINIQVWDVSNVSLVDAAIKKSDLGLNPQIDGQLIRLPVPELNEERRTELKKIINNKKLELSERFAAQLKLNKLPKNSSKIRIRNRCEISGRPHGVYRKLTISRIAVREMTSPGKIPGMTKSSW